MDSYNIFLVELGKRIKIFRELCEMSQKELAEKIECHIKTIQRIEKGTAGTTFQKLMRMTIVFGIDYDMLVCVSKKKLPKQIKR